MNGEVFYSYVKKEVFNDISAASKLKTITRFDPKQLEILRTAKRTAMALIAVFHISRHHQIEWLGCNNQNDEPIDMIIGNLKLSLKESSFILKNMSLSRYVWIITGINVGRAFHIFKRFAPNEYEEWFRFCWIELRRSLKDEEYRYAKEGYVSRIWRQGREIILEVSRDNDSTAKLPDSDRVTLKNFEEKTTPDIREHVFSKWIKQKLQSREDYEDIKKKCAVAAAHAFAEYINRNKKADNKSLLEFLRFCDDEYYYVKNSGRVEIFKVPRISQANHVVRIVDIRPSVPRSQPNILTRIENCETGKILTIRNELRFSHGQFNGTPEAKMYYESGSSLEVVYDPIQIR
jgi:hypothetical protein